MNKVIRWGPQVMFVVMVVAAIISLTTGAFGPPPWWGWVLWFAVMFALIRARNKRRNDEDRGAADDARGPGGPGAGRR
jgi:polyferredoxin